MSEHKEPIPSMIYNAAVGGHVTNSQQIIDENLNREQNDINQETVGAVPYNSTTPNGMGRIVLKKTDNFKEVVEAQTNGNTIFVIKYDFTLTDDVTIPANCVLDFQGGSISNGSCICQNTGIKGSPKFINISNIGTIAGNYIDLSWFVLSDYATMLQNFVDATDGTNAVVFIPVGTYVISSLEIKTSSESEISSKSTFTIKGDGVSSIININGGSGIKLFRKSFIENLSIRGSSNNYALRIGGAPATYGPTIQGIRISGIDFRNNSGGALYGVDWLINLTIEKCYFTNNGNSDKYVCYIGGNNSTTVAIDRCYFSNNENCKAALYITADIGYTYITRSVFESSNRLIHAHSGSLSVEDCYFEWVTDYAVCCDGTTKDVVIRSCEFKYQRVNKKAYIYLYNVGTILIENNRFGHLYTTDNSGANSISGSNMLNAVYVNNKFTDPNDLTPKRIGESGKEYISNLAKNSSFKDAYTSTSYFERIDTEGCFDSYCMRFHSSETAVKVCSAVLLTLTASKRYVLSFYAKQNVGGDSNPVHLVVTGAFSAGDMSFTPEPYWKRYILSFTPSSSGNLYMYFSALIAQTSVDILIDDVQLEQLDEGTASEYVMITNTTGASYKGRLPVLGGNVRPVEPTTGDIFFDKTLGTNGKPIWYAGNNIWVDAIGATV